MAVLLRSLFWIGVALLLAKLVWGWRLREVSRRLSSAVNLALVLLIVTYAGYFVWQYWAAR